MCICNDACCYLRSFDNQGTTGQLVWLDNRFAVLRPWEREVQTFFSFGFPVAVAVGAIDVLRNFVLPRKRFSMNKRLFRKLLKAHAQKEVCQVQYH